MKLSDSSEKSTYPEEELLIKWAKWPIFGVQFNGHLSLSVISRKLNNDVESQPKKYRKSLQFHFYSVPFVFHALLLTIFSVIIICFGQTGYSAFKRMEKLSSDAGILAAYSLCGFSYTMGIRIWSLIRVKKNLAFWTYQVDKVRLIQPNLWDFKTVSDLQKEIRASFLRTVFFLCAVLMTVFCSDFILVDIFQISKYSVITDSVLGQNGPILVGGLLWTYSYFSNAFLSLWLSFFIKLYSAGVSSIRGEFEGGKITGAQISRLSKTYNVLVNLVDHFNDEMGGRIFLEVGFNLIFILGSTYFIIVSGKMGEYGNAITNATCALLSMHVLYVYGNDCENLEVARLKLVNLLCEVEESDGPWEMGAANKVSVSKKRKCF